MALRVFKNITAITFIYLLSCTNSSQTEVDSTKTVTENAVPEQKTASSSKKFLVWNTESKDAFLKKCIESSSQAIGANEVDAYCSCLLSKFQQKFPTADSAVNLTKDKMMNMAKECLK